MSTPTNDGGPAFPASTPTGWAIGMSLRDYYAAHASDDDIQALIAECAAKRSLTTWTRQQARFVHADRMLAARNQTTK